MPLAFTSGVGSGTGGGVTSVTAADPSIVVGGSATAPTIATATLDVIAAQHPPAAAVPFNGQKGTGVANGAAAQDIAAFGQIPTALPPNGSASGDLAGSFPSPTVAAIHETSGPTKLTIGTITDGEFLKRVGATLVSALAPVTSIFGRTGAVAAAAGDYTAAQVTNAADKIASSIQSFAGGYRSTHATTVSGYGTGAGGAVTQLTSRTTAVTCDHPTGRITTFNSSIVSGNPASFTVNCASVGSTDTVIVNCVNDVTTIGTPFGPYVGQVANGSFVLTYYNNSSGSVSTAFVFNYAIIHAVAS